MSDLYAVTGASGYIGSHVTRALLARGFTVRACVRDPNNADKTAHLSALAQGLPGTLTFERGNLLESGSYDAAFEGVTHVIHTAAAVMLAAKNPQVNIVDPSIKGTQNVLDSAKAAGTVKRFVQTSSVAAVVQSPEKGRIYSEADWNTTATVKTDPYGLAKAQAEQLAQRFGDENGLNPVFINPALVIGPVYTKAHTKASPSVVRDLVRGSFPACPQMHFGLVDVRDVAEAHVEAALRADVSGRHILCAESWWMQDMAKALKTMWPDRKIKTGKLPNFILRIVALFDKRLSSAVLKNLLGRECNYDNQRSIDALGVAYRPVRDSLKDCVQSMLDAGFVR
jgi:nucleoside-diphosphate-sugar epimerase